jgi:F-type H+-transporting ATPase subunit a
VETTFAALVCAPKLETELLTEATEMLFQFAAGDSGEFSPPTIEEFFPPAVLFEGTIFEMNRIVLIRLLAVTALVLIFWLGTRKMRMVPGRFQGTVEMALNLVRVNIAEDLLGEKDGKRFLPLLTTIFFLVLFMNLTGIIPGLNIAGTSVIGMPLVLAVAAYVAFVYAGLRKHPVAFLKNALVPPGVPWPLYIIVTPIELVSTFILRPVTLTLRLLMNMVVGHFLLVLFFSSTHFFILYSDSWMAFFGIGTIAFSIAFTFFEILVAILQAYVFTLLTAVYLQLALAEEH